MPRKRNPDMTATDRALQLYMKLLFSGDRLFLADLAKQFDCTKSTLLKTVGTIEASGIAEITSGLEDTRRWFQLKHLPGTPHIGLTEKEVEKLALCRDMLAHLLPQGVERIISESITKISMLMEKAENRAEATARKAIHSPWGHIDYAPFQESLETLMRATPSHTVCMVEYHEQAHRIDWRKGLQVYEFVPVRLATEDDALNMEGWMVTDKGTPEVIHPLTLAVHRIQSCTPTRRILAECPPLPEHNGAFGLVGYAAFPVRVRFCAELAPFIRERFWSKEQGIVDLEDGEIELGFMAADEDELIGWVLSFGNGAELMAPKSLRERLFDEVQDLWEVYAGEEADEN